MFQVGFLTMTSRDHYRNGESIFDKDAKHIKNLSEDILKLICLLTHRNKQNTSTGEKYQMGFVVLS